MADIGIGSFSNVFGSLGSTTFIIALCLILVGAIIAVAIYVRYRKKFDIVLEVYSERAKLGNTIFFDRGAILKDKKTNTPYLRILGLRKELPCPPYFVLEKTNKGDMIRLWRKSENEITFMLPPTINKELVVKQDGRVYRIQETEMKQLEGDIAYWVVRRQKENKGLFDVESNLMKLLPYLPSIMGGAITIFILYILLDNLPAILGELKLLVVELRGLQGGGGVPVQ